MIADSVANRPETMADYVGQGELTRRLGIVLQGAQARGVRAPHCLISGPAGHGKTTIARIIAAELGVSCEVASGPALLRVVDVAAVLTSLRHGSVLFIDEIHRLPMNVEECLYEPLEDGTFTTAGATGSMVLKLPPFVLVGATTRPGALSAPLRDRFGFHGTVAPYSQAEIAEIVARAWRRAEQEHDADACEIIAERSKCVPRIALHLASRVLDWCALQGTAVTGFQAILALEAFGIAETGLDELDMRILTALVRTFRGKAVGLEALAQALDVDPSTIERDHEGYLVRSGLMLRSASGRVATPATFDLIGAPS